jgi:pantoate--beta-alanine ligase
VATVVTKLFNMVQPDRAYFGQKDAQQAIVLTRMVHDLAVPVDVRVIPTVREPEGLALSSRNVYLSADEHRQALALWRALGAARSAIERGERDASSLERIMREVIAHDAPDGRIDYISIVDLNSLQPKDRIDSGALIALAVFIGRARLIDNLIVRDAGTAPRFS